MNPYTAEVTHQTRGFPNATITTRAGTTAVEVTLIAQLGAGAGSPLVQQAADRQSLHPGFIDALDEPSARLGGLSLENDRSSLYSFVVGPRGHPFHSHAGPRVFTAVSGSSGAQLRFSTLPRPEFENFPERFVESLQLIDIPPDSLFTVRFGGGIWHQFANAKEGSVAPTLFALSCHPDEFAGIHDAEQVALIRNNQATIPLLTEVLPEAVSIAVDEALCTPHALNRIELSLEPEPRRWKSRLCAIARNGLGRLRCWLTRLPSGTGIGREQQTSAPWMVKKQSGAGSNSLLDAWRSAEQADHDDTFECTVNHPVLKGKPAAQLLASLLDAFVEHPPWSITALMRFRNALVLPLGLRRSHLGCPVSSLVSDTAPICFAGRHRVLRKSVDDQGSSAEVLLGADDRHLQFRTAVRVRRSGSRQMTFSLSTRVACSNRFGRFYMAAIRRTHQQLVSPMLLKTAIAAVLNAQTATESLQDSVSNQPTL